MAWYLSLQDCSNLPQTSALCQKDAPASGALSLLEVCAIIALQTTLSFKTIEFRLVSAAFIV